MTAGLTLRHRLPKAPTVAKLDALRATPPKNPRDQALIEVMAGCGLAVGRTTVDEAGAYRLLLLDKRRYDLEATAPGLGTWRLDQASSAGGQTSLGSGPVYGRSADRPRAGDER
jgi:hypothetical protein